MFIFAKILEPCVNLFCTKQCFARMTEKMSDDGNDGNFDDNDDKND